MASQLLTQFKTGIKSLSLEPSSGGCFEVTVGDDLIYSKLETGQFPEEAEITSQVEQLASA